MASWTFFMMWVLFGIVDTYIMIYEVIIKKWSSVSFLSASWTFFMVWVLFRIVDTNSMIYEVIIKNGRRSPFYRHLGHFCRADSRKWGLRLYY